MKIFKLTLMIMLMFALQQLQGQSLLNQLKKKAAEKALDAIGGNKSGNTTPAPQQQDNGTNNSGGSSNKGGGGLVSTPPDVKQNLTEANDAYKAGNYGDARYSVQQAMLGVEMEIGNKILQSLPESISGLNKEPSRDKVTSTGFGWVGLTIERSYSKGDKDFDVTVANNAAWMSAVNMYLTGGGFSQTTNGKQNMKQTRVKGFRAVIEYDDGSGYKLSVPIGQTSLLICEGRNFATEQEMMTAANAVDIAGIKKMLGEQ
jgi:hypothetical protein